MNTLSAKTALVTGAAKGIGAAIAKKLAKAGFRVAVHYHHSETAAKATCGEILAAGGEARLFSCDLSEEGAAEALVKQVETEYGPLHTVVCNAGVIFTQPLTFTSLKDWHALMAANLDAPFLLTKAASRFLARRRAGRIIYLSSDAALMGDLHRGAYSASKAGLLGLCRTASRELAPSGITVNAVAPGIIETDMTADMPESRRKKQLASVPMNRFGKAEEVANVVAFLASSAAAYITGQTLCVDGGMNTAR